MIRQNMNEKDWLACYIYFTGSADKLLIEDIFPLIQEAFQNKWVEQYFFIRYSDSHGKHIRLRFKGKREILDTKVKSLLRQKFPNSRFVTYRPELTRYGGKNGIVLAEKIFESSSNTILSFLSENKNANYEKSLGFSLQLNISMMHAFGMQKAEAIAFFNHISGQGNEKIFIKNFNTEQGKMILPSLSKLWFSLEQLQTFDKMWFNTWLKNVTSIGEELKRLYQNDKLKPLDPKKTHIQNPLWYLYESYVHMNNNRLGIYNEDESYIAYIIKQGLSYEK